MSILDKTNEELFDFSDVDDEVEEILEEEDNRKKYQSRYANQFPDAMDWAFKKDSPVFKLIADFDKKFDVIPAYEFLLRVTLMEMFQYGMEVNDIYGEVNNIIDELQSFDGDDEIVD